MEMTDQKVKVHGIKLLEVKVRELGIKQTKPLNLEDIDGFFFNIQTGHSKYINNQMSVGMIVTGSMPVAEGEESPLSIIVDLFGIFHVDEEVFDVNMLNRWASENAPMILFPFVRENIYALAIRCGISGLMLPLISVPTLATK